MVLEDVAGASDWIGVAERLRAQPRAPMEVRKHRLFTTASIGIVVGADERPEELLIVADVAMYQAENMGKGHHVMSDPSE